MQVIKRNGDIVPYDFNRIFNAIKAARNSADTTIDDEKIRYVAIAVENAITNNEKINVEEIQDIVELKLIEFGLSEIARHYVQYRHKHSIRREAGTHLMNTYNEIFFTDAKNSDQRRENANINTDTPMGAMLKLGTEGAKYFIDNYVLPKEFVDADHEGFVHYHDKDFSLLTFNCCQIDLLKLFHGGFNTGHGFLREPNSIRSYASLACIAIQSNQNDMFGGQSIMHLITQWLKALESLFGKPLFTKQKKQSRTLKNKCHLMNLKQKLRKILAVTIILRR